MTPGPVLIGTPTETFTPTQSGALATVMHAWARAAAAEGCDAAVVANRCGAEPFGDVESVLLEPPTRPRGIMRTLRRAERKWRHWTALDQGRWMRRVGDVVERRGWGRRPLVLMNGPELAVALRRRFPDAWILHHFENQLPCKPRPRAGYAAAVRRTTAVSDFTGRWVAEHYGPAVGEVRTVLNGVDTERFRPRAADEAAAAAEPVIVQFVGRTGIEKAPDLLLDAALRLVEQGGVTADRFAVRLVGSNHFDGYTEDAYQQRLRVAAARLEAAGVRVEPTGHVGRDELPGLMRSADVHVTPSRWDEPFGLTTAEGMASGLATVGSHTGGTPEVLGGAGAVFDRDDVAGLARVLAGWINDPAARAAAGAACRLRAEALTWAASWASLKALLPAAADEAGAAA